MANKFILKEKIPQAIILVIESLIVVAWFDYHIAETQLVAAISGGVGLLLSILAFYESIVSEKEAESQKGSFQKFSQSVLRFFLRNDVLIIAFVVIMIVGNTVSTLFIYTDEGRGKQIACGRTGNDSTATLTSNEEGIIRHTLLVNPFGSSVYIDVDGYLREQFEVFPWLGKKLFVEDLQPAPTILVRVDRHSNEVLSGRFDIYENNVLVDTVYVGERESTSIMLGIERKIPFELSQYWREELQADGSDDTSIADMMKGWRTFILSDVIALPGKDYKVIAYTQADTIIGVIEFKPFQDEFQDFLIQDNE